MPCNALEVSCSGGLCIIEMTGGRRLLLLLPLSKSPYCLIQTWGDLSIGRC